MAVNENASGVEAPEGLVYFPSHVWLDRSASPERLGVTAEGARRLGSVIFADLPAAGDQLSIGGRLCELESSKSVQSVLSPVAGAVVRANPDMDVDAGVVNADPYGRGWLCEVEVSAASDEAMDASAYRAFCAK